MDECSLTYAVNTAAVTLARCLDDDELTMLAAVLVQLGDTLTTIVTHRSICAEKNSDTCGKKC